ncbi:RagB/SusD family nutrient uptake outer membrane protein [Bacteroides uniformis]|nr:RagB/SusD family nutrient uptake outer membrane protein [Bacteroides uniformis]
MYSPICLLRPKHTLLGKKAPAYTQVKYGVLNDQWGTDNNATDIILMRVEEMYLIKAEAQAKCGNVSGGVSTLNPLVTAYRDPSYQCTATTPEAVQEAVWQQRRLEFWGEGMAYFDIMRLNKGVNRLKAAASRLLPYLILQQVIRFRFTVFLIRKAI